jgi:hypothetical protein
LISSYEIWYKEVIQAENLWTKIATVPLTQLSYTHTPMPSTNDAQYRVRAVSDFRGVGVYGIRNTFIVAAKPSVLTAPVIDSFSKNHVTISWSLSSDGGSPIFGFRLYRNDKINGGQTLIYDGSKIPTVAAFLDKDVEIENQYTYQVLAINKVGTSGYSPESAKVIPSSKPGKAKPPKYIDSTSTTISVSFEAIDDNGGLPIINYLIYRDDGLLNFAGTSYSTSILTFTINKANDTALVTGTIYSFYVVAVNSLGEGIPSDIV